MQQNLRLILGLIVGVIVIAFFLPWIEIQSNAVGTFSKMLTGKRQDTIDSVSGFRVPVIANSRDARFMIEVIRMFCPDIKDADKKSWLIWVVPLLAVFFWWLFFLWGSQTWLHVILGLAGCSIFVTGGYYVLTTKLNKLVLSVSIAQGLWLTLLGYLAMGLLGIYLLIAKKKAGLPQDKQGEYIS